MGTINFSSRRQRLIQNKIESKFNYLNIKSGELAVKAREKSKKNLLIAGSLPAQNDTYVADIRDIKTIKKDFNDQAKLIEPFVDFFYLDVIFTFFSTFLICISFFFSYFTSYVCSF